MNSRKFMAWLLCLCMLLSMLPAYATEEGCSHANTESAELWYYCQFTAVDDENHTVSGEKVLVTTCADCGRTISEESLGQKTETTAHDYDESGMCVDCGYQRGEATAEPTEEPVMEPATTPTQEPETGDSVENMSSAPVSKFNGYMTLDDFGISSATTFSLRRNAATSTYLNPQTIRPKSSYYGYEWICNRYGYSYPFTASFTLDSDYMPQNSVYIAIKNYDCDEFGDYYSCEYDQVYINGHCIGVLTGNNNTSNTTLLKIDRSYLKAGTNNITIRVGIKIKRPDYWYRNDPAGTIHTDDPYSQWWLRVDDIQVLCDGGSAEGRPDLFRVNLTNAELADNQVNCYVTTQVEDSQNRTFSLEYALYDWSSEESATYGQIIDDDFATIYDGNYNHEGSLTMPVNSLSGTYTAVVYLKVKENGVETILAYDEESFEYETGVAPAFDVQNFTATPATLEWTSDPVAINLSADIDVNAGLTDMFFYISDAIQTPAPVDANGHVTGTLVLPENGFYTVELHYTKEGKSYKKTTTVEINNILTPLAAPILNVSGDFNIAEGETVSIDWNPVENATAYSIIVWDFTNGVEAATEVDRVNDQTGLSYSYTFNKAGSYIIGVYSRCPGSTEYCQSRTNGSVNVYVAASASVCPHTNVTAQYDNGEQEPIFSNITETHHDVQNGYVMYCEDCKQYTGAIGYFDAVPEPHGFANGDVCACGYDRSSCAHTPVDGSAVYVKTLFEAENESTHKAVSDVVSYTCSKCHQTYEKIELRSEDRVETGIPHAWDSDGVCLSDGCAYACAHTEYIMAWVDGKSKTVSITDNKDGATHTHVYTAKATCSNCPKDLGMMEETNSAEEHRVRDGKAYYREGDTWHQKITPRVCSCGYAEEPRVSDAEPHCIGAIDTIDDYKISETAPDKHIRVYTSSTYCGDCKKLMRFDEGEDVYDHADLDMDNICDYCKASISEVYKSFNMLTSMDRFDTPASIFDYNNIDKAIFLNARENAKMPEFVAFFFEAMGWGDEIEYSIDEEDELTYGAGHSATLLIDVNGAGLLFEVGQYNYSGDNPEILKLILGAGYNLDVLIESNRIAGGLQKFATYLTPYEVTSLLNGTSTSFDSGFAYYVDNFGWASDAQYPSSHWDKAVVFDVDASQGARMFEKVKEVFETETTYWLTGHDCDQYALEVLLAGLDGRDKINIADCNSATPNGTYEKIAYYAEHSKNENIYIHDWE